jgi:hypothetical protein
MNPSRSRQRREPPARSGPIRNSVTTPPEKKAAPGAANGPVAGENPCDPSRWAPMSREIVNGALESGVRTAYAVIDEYMRRGYEAARMNREHPDRRGYMSDNSANYGNRPNPWGPMAPFTEQWMAAMRAWTEAWSAFVPGGLQQMWNPAGAGYSNAAPAPTVSVQVSSPRPTEVTANLRPGADCVSLEADPLQGEGASAATIKHVLISHEPGRVRVSVNVGADQPAGCYRGAIRRKADRSIVGDLTVVISDPVRASA